MAIQNASDLLVYAKTTDPAPQKTRIRVLTTDPLIHPEGSTSGTIKINNVTNNSGVVSDDLSTAAIGTNTGSNVLAKIGTILSTNNNYLQSAESTDGDYTYRDYTNYAVGLVPTLEIVSGTSTLNEDAIIIEILTPGSSAIFDPVAYSTSASFSTNMDLRDVTNKDSDGWSESLGGLKSFEVSTDILQSINPDVPLDGTDFFDKLQARSLVDLSFSDRIRNIIRTNLTQSGVDGFNLLDTAGTITQTNLQPDPFGGNTASKLNTSSQSALAYTVNAARIEGKKVTWSIYFKGVDASNRKATVAINDNTIAQGLTATKMLGDGDITFSSPNYYVIDNLSTSTWSRFSFSTDTLSLDSKSSLLFYIFPGLYSASVSKEVFTSSWQIEVSPEATDYQDPTDITHWQGNALVSSVSFDAGVEDNLTCSATFTGTGNIYPNGLGPELIEDTGFDNPSYWSITPADGSLSVVENGYGKVKSDGSNTFSSIFKTSLLVEGNYYLLEYTVSQSNTGGVFLSDGWNSATEPDIELPISVGTHKVLIYPGTTALTLKRKSTNNDIWLSSISLKKVL